jgi:hypothetical protein
VIAVLSPRWGAVDAAFPSRFVMVVLEYDQRISLQEVGSTALLTPSQGQSSATGEAARKNLVYLQPRVPLIRWVTATLFVGQQFMEMIEDSLQFREFENSERSHRAKMLEEAFSVQLVGHLG